jgi:hypothetical protein
MTGRDSDQGDKGNLKRVRPTYVVRLRPQPRVDAIRALRVALKILLRRFGLRAVEVKEER